MRIKRLIFLVFAALFFAGACQTIVAQTVYEIEGAVYGPDSKPIANVVMTLENHARAQIAQDMTNSDGRYRFSGIVAGVYYISVKPYENEFQQIFQRIELINTAVGVTNFSTERVDFSLRPVARRRDSPAPGTVFAQTVPPDAEKEYLSATKSLSKGDKDEATIRLDNAIKLFPTYFLALQQLGLLYVEKERYQEAVAPLKKAIQVNSKGAQSHLGLGIAYVNLDHLKEAIEELNISLTFDPKLFRAHLYLGMALISMGDLDAAERSLKQAYVIGGPTQARAAHLYLASIYNTRKQYQRAINELETYLRDNPKASNASKIQEAIQKLKAKL
jgi:tetratricopeptide (TPR) repeat protein